MQQHVVVDELDVARRQPHREVQLRIVGQCVEGIERLDVERAQARRFRKTLRAVEVLALVEDAERAGMPAEHRDHEPRVLAGRYLAAPVVRHRHQQPRQQVGAGAAQRVEDRQRADQQRIAAAPRFAQAQQADDVARIGVEGLAFARLVDAHVGVGAAQAQIAHMAEHMPARVLRARATQVRADAGEQRGAFEQRVPLHRQPPQQRKAASVQQFVTQRTQARRQPRQRKVGCGHRADARGGITGLRKEAAHRAIELGQIVGVEHADPVGARRHLAADPGRQPGLRRRPSLD